MDIGLYMLKFPFRKVIGFLLPACKNISPNLISLMLIPIGVLTAFLYFYFFLNGPQYLLLIAIVLIFLRMIVGTLDGMVAITYNKSTVEGDLLNRLTPELCDLLLFPTIIYFYFDFKLLAVLAMTLAWATPFMGLLGAPSKCPVQSVGPVGQTDRLAALMLFSLLEFLSRQFNWNIDFIKYFLYWLIFGGSITLFLRLKRHIKEARKIDESK